MTTYVNFAPTSAGPFVFQCTLDGQTYRVVVTYNLTGRFYINVYDLSGNLIVAKAMVGSPPNYDINLVWGYFASSTLVFRQATQQFEINP